MDIRALGPCVYTYMYVPIYIHSAKNEDYSRLNIAYIAYCINVWVKVKMLLIPLSEANVYIITERFVGIAGSSQATKFLPLRIYYIS